MKLFPALVFLLLSASSLAQPKQLSIKEFLKLSSSDTTSYAVKGVVSKIRSTSSGSFYLQDDSGTLLVYGIQDGKGSSFKQMDISNGDTLTVMGRFTLYAGTTKEMKDGRLIAKSDGPEHNLSFYDRLERKPSFKGKTGKEADEAFRAWVQQNLRKPGAKGQVSLRFVVGRNGGVQEVQITKRAENEALNEEALRVVKSSPKWKPAKADGAPVRTNHYITVVFD